MPQPSWIPRTRAGWIWLGGGAVLFSLVAFVLTLSALSHPFGSDVDAYWNAALRLRAGEPLYTAGPANASDLYRYAPWFAFAWVPLTFLAHDVVAAAWVGLMVLAALASSVPLLWRGPTGWAAFSLLAPFQLESALYGNVQPAIVLALLWGVERRSGPAWIAAAASLKGLPLLFALTYAGRGEWRRAALAVLASAALAAPALLFDLSSYPTATGHAQLSLLEQSAALYLVVALGAAVVAWAVARSRFGWLASSFAVLAAFPRLLTYEIGFLLVGLARPRPGDQGDR